MDCDLFGGSMGARGVAGAASLATSRASLGRVVSVIHRGDGGAGIAAPRPRAAR